MEAISHIKSFISAALDYSRNKSDKNTATLQRNLQILSVVSDVSIFDPGHCVSVEFYVSLHDLLSGLDSRSVLTWSALAALQQACRNPSARQALIHTFKFTPILTRLLGGHLSKDKTMKVLLLLQDLTYGIKISWQEGHLPFLISTLVDYVKGGHQEYLGLSLSILVNLCHKNLPAVYTLLRCVENKSFLKTLLSLEYDNVNTKIQVSKLLIILQRVCGSIPDSQLLSFVSLTFTAFGSAFTEGDVFLLRHMVDFFQDVKENASSQDIILKYDKFDTSINTLLQYVNDKSKPECVGLLFELIHAVVVLDVPNLSNFYPSMVLSAIKWINTESAYGPALTLIKTVTVESGKRDKDERVFDEILRILEECLPVLTVMLDKSGSEEMFPTTSEMKSKLTALLELLQELCKSPKLRQRIESNVNQNLFLNLFKPLLSVERFEESLFQTDVTSLYTEALDFVCCLACHGASWLDLYTNLLSNKQVQMVLAITLYIGKPEMKRKVLGMIGTVGFTAESVAGLSKVMSDLEPLLMVPLNATKLTNSISTTEVQQDVMPVFGKSQEERLDQVIVKLEEFMSKRELKDLPTTAVMELYEYKLAAMGHSERALQASLDAASNHATHLQHKLAQSSAEVSRLHQLLYYTQQCLEGAQSEKQALQKKIENLHQQTQKDHNTFTQEIKRKAQEIKELHENIAEVTREKDSSQRDCKSLQEQIELMGREMEEQEHRKQMLTNKIKELEMTNQEIFMRTQKLEEKVRKREKEKEELEKEIEKLLKNIEHMKTEYSSLELLCRSHEQTIGSQEGQLKEMQEELRSLQRIREAIYEISAGKKKLEK